MQRLDQYAIPIAISMGGTTVTPEIVNDVVIRIGKYQLSYASGEISYNSIDNVWEFPMTQEMSKNFNVYENVQIMVVMGNDQVLSAVKTINVCPSIIEVE